MEDISVDNLLGGIDILKKETFLEKIIRLRYFKINKNIEKYFDNVKSHIRVIKKYKEIFGDCNPRWIYSHNNVLTKLYEDVYTNYCSHYCPNKDFKHFNNENKRTYLLLRAEIDKLIGITLPEFQLN